MIQVGPGVHTFSIAGERLILSESRQEIHALNACATIIWDSIRGGESSSVIKRKLCDAFGVTSMEAERLMEIAYSDWRERGFLKDSIVATATIEPHTPADEFPPYSTPNIIAERYYTILNSQLCIRFTAADQISVIHPILAHLECARCEASVVLDIIQAAGRLFVYCDTRPEAACESLTWLAPAVKGLVWTHAVNNSDFFMGFHAGAVANSHGSILLPGPAGSGKSTITAALVKAGFQYFSDEMALIREGDFYALPFPMSLCVKDSGTSVLAKSFPILQELPFHLRPDGKRVAYMRPPADSLPPQETASPVRMIVFPRFAEGATSACQRIASADAVRRMMTECLAVRRPLTVARVQAFIEWLTLLPSFEVVYGSPYDCVNIIREIESQIGRPGR